MEMVGIRIRNFDTTMKIILIFILSALFLGVSSNECLSKETIPCYVEFIKEVLPRFSNPDSKEPLSITFKSKTEFSACVEEASDKCGGMQFIDLVKIANPQGTTDGYCSADGCPDEDESLEIMLKKYPALECLDDQDDLVLNCWTQTWIKTTELFTEKLVKKVTFSQEEWCIVYKMYLNCATGVAEKHCGEEGKFVMTKVVGQFIKNVTSKC